VAKSAYYPAINFGFSGGFESSGITSTPPTPGILISNSTMSTGRSRTCGSAQN